MYDWHRCWCCCGTFTFLGCVRRTGGSQAAVVLGLFRCFRWARLGPPPKPGGEGSTGPDLFCTLSYSSRLSSYIHTHTVGFGTQLGRLIDQHGEGIEVVSSFGGVSSFPERAYCTHTYAYICRLRLLHCIAQDTLKGELPTDLGVGWVWKSRTGPKKHTRDTPNGRKAPGAAEAAVCYIERGLPPSSYFVSKIKIPTSQKSSHMSRNGRRSTKVCLSW